MNNSWLREHLGGRVVALAVWVNGKCDASVFGDDEAKTRHRISCDTEDMAKKRATDLLLDAYPHSCSDPQSNCWPEWGMFAPHSN